METEFIGNLVPGSMEIQSQFFPRQILYPKKAALRTSKHFRLSKKTQQALDDNEKQWAKQ